MDTTTSTQSIIDHLDRNVVTLWVSSLIYPYFVRAIGVKNLLVHHLLPPTLDDH